MKHSRLLIFLALIVAIAAQDQEVGPIEQQAQQIPAQINQQDQFFNVNQVRMNNRMPNQTGRQVVHRPYQPPVTARKIRTAIDDSLLFLQNNQQPDGAIGHRETVLAALAMLAAGADPASDLALQRALGWLAAQGDVNDTYVRAIRANVWEYALRKAPYDESLKAALQADYDWLIKALGDKQGWRYNMQSTDWDNSVTQYGVLGIWAASRAGFDPGQAFWQRMSQHFQQVQNADGGWGYTTSGSTPNMATAGLATMFLVFDNHYGRTCYAADNPEPFAEGPAAKVLTSIERGMEWLGKQGVAGNRDGYYLYGIERTGVASGRKYIGGRDWFREGVDVVLQAQQADGSFALQGHGGRIAQTAFATLFLVYGGAPVAFNKLQYGQNESWNLNPRDLANLTRDLWGAYEQPLNWHAVSIQAPAEEFEAPILFISGNQALDLSEEEMLKLREYLRRGGTILAEPSDHSKPFEESIRLLVRTMFPEQDYPGFQLTELAADDPIYTVLPQKWEERPSLEGISDGARTFFVLSRGYLSGDWQRDRTDSDAFKLAMNLLFYTTNLGMPPAKFASVLPATPAATARSVTARVARVRHQGGWPRDWDAAPYAYAVLSPFVTHQMGFAVEEATPVRLGEDSLDGLHLLHLTGRGTLTLDETERSALKAFVKNGGYVIADAYAGSPEFGASARLVLEEIFGSLTPLADDEVIAAGRFAGGTDLARQARLSLPARQLLRAANEDPRGQKLLTTANRQVIFSSFDITGAMAGIANYRAPGYQPESARAIIANLLGFAMAD